jgi:hypothetical protein
MYWASTKVPLVSLGCWIKLDKCDRYRSGGKEATSIPAPGLECCKDSLRVWCGNRPETFNVAPRHGRYSRYKLTVCKY